jgi:hypothetical protein
VKNAKAAQKGSGSGKRGAVDDGQVTLTQIASGESAGRGSKRLNASQRAKATAAAAKAKMKGKAKAVEEVRAQIIIAWRQFFFRY